MLNRSREITIKKITAVTCTIILGLLLTALISNMYRSSQEKDRTKDLSQGLENVRNAYENMNEKDELYKLENQAFISSMAGHAAYYFDKHGYNNKTMEKVIADIGEYTWVYFFKGEVNEEAHGVDGYMIRDPRATDDDVIKETLTDYKRLSKDQLYELLTKNEYSCGSVDYYAEKIGDKGYLILIYSTEDILKSQSVMSAFATDRDDEMLRINVQTGIIEDSSIPEIIGKPCSSHININQLINSREGKMEKMTLADGRAVYAIVDKQYDNQLFCAYSDSVITNLTLIRNIALPVILEWLFMLMILIYVLALITHRNLNKVEYLHLFGKRYLDRKLINHVNGMSFFAVLLILISLLYVQTLINYSNQNVNSQRDLKSLNYIIGLNNSNVDAIYQDYDLNQRNLIDYIADYYMRYPEEQNHEDIASLLKYMPEVRELSVFNREGECILDVDNDSEESHVGYTISVDESVKESVCWDILNGKSDYAYYMDIQYNYYEARRSMDGGGLIRIKTNADVLRSFDVLSSVSDTVQNAYFGLASKAFIDLENPNQIYIYELGEKPYAEKNSLPSEVLEKSYSGISRIGGAKYYINSIVSSDINVVLMSIVYAFELSGISSPWVLLVIILTFVLQDLMFMLVMSVSLSEPPSKEVKRNRNIMVKETLDEQFMDDRFRKVIRNMFYSTCIMIIMLLGVDSLFGKTSLLRYLFGNEWAKGINLFSITIILMMIAGAIIGGGALQSLVLFFTKNMGPRGVTIGRMVSSIIKFIILLIVLMMILVDIGIDPAKLLAGAGIAGALVSFCAQQTVNDFLSGFFIVFEGLFNIGDWITVNNFRGQVIEIGIRTTKIAIGGNVQIVNNSELKTITIMAPNGTGAICEVDIAYKEDIDKVIDIIKSSTSVYAENIPAIVEGPYVDGVIDLGSSGVKLRLWALADQECVYAVERDMRRVTKDLFDENGIEIPFQQVTLHTVSY